ncbi:hypothetical protein MLD38_025995 [Melastoma candidum]|uniref:Uncharacterized protein n=1 Tax=Melastoma candidum TaxID=119954 RepID=A0ACB9NY35_9MYRT|nr:hypothetical protein MLD38_025995 [Melastoma candidum]
MANDQEMSGWTDLLHSSTELLEQAAPSAQFPPLQRNLDQLETLSKKLKAKTQKAKAPSQSTAATSDLVLKCQCGETCVSYYSFSFYLKTTFEDVFPVEATSLEEYLQQVREMTLISAIQEAQKDNIASAVSSPQISYSPSGTEVVPAVNKPLLEKKATAYGEVVKNLNSLRERGLPSKPVTAFKGAYDSLGFDTSGGRSVGMQKIWHLVQAMVGEVLTTQYNVSKEISLVIGARRHLEFGHEKYIMDTIQSHPAQLEICKESVLFYEYNYGTLDFDAADARKPPVDTTWQTGYYGEALDVAQSSRTAYHFAPLLVEWINTGGLVSAETSAIASEECEKLLRMGDRFLPAILYPSKEIGDEGYNIDATHITIVLADYGVLNVGTGSGSLLGVMDAYSKSSSMICQYDLCLGNLPMALEYYALAAAAVGGGQLSWTGRGSADHQLQRSLMLKQLLTEVLLRDGGIYFLLGVLGKEGELARFLPDVKSRQQFLLEAARQCTEAGLYDKSVEILKRIGAFSMAMDTINRCLSDAICAFSRGRLDGESQTTGLIHSGNEILETYKYQPESREVARLSFLPLDPRAPDSTMDVALNCMDSVAETDGSLCALRSKIANFLASNMRRTWPRDLYKKVGRNL